MNLTNYDIEPNRSPNFDHMDKVERNLILPLRGKPDQKCDLSRRPKFMQFGRADLIPSQSKHCLCMTHTSQEGVYTEENSKG